MQQNRNNATEDTTQRFLQELNKVLPDSRLILYGIQRTISLLDTQNSHIITQQRLTPNEWKTFLTLLAFYPNYTPYETLLSVVTSLSVEQCRRELQEVQRKERKYFKRVFRPAARAITNLRIKLEQVVPMLHIAPLPQCGYLLMIKSTRLYPYEARQEEQ